MPGSMGPDALSEQSVIGVGVHRSVHPSIAGQSEHAAYSVAIFVYEESTLTSLLCARAHIEFRVL